MQSQTMLPWCPVYRGVNREWLWRPVTPITRRTKGLLMASVHFILWTTYLINKKGRNNETEPGSQKETVGKWVRQRAVRVREAGEKVKSKEELVTGRGTSHSRAFFTKAKSESLGESLVDKVLGAQAWGPIAWPLGPMSKIQAWWHAFVTSAMENGEI